MDSGDNGKPKPEEHKFKYQAMVMFNDETGEIAFETNVPNIILGYGMLEFGKKGVDNHIAQLQMKNKPQVIPAKGGIMNFARRFAQ